MISLQKVAAATALLAAALSLQGCKKTAAAVPANQPPVMPPTPVHSSPPVARVAVDGHPCEHTWSAKWRDGSRSVCRTFCCYHRNRLTHRRTRHSFCRVHENGHEVLKACAPRGAALLALSATETVEEEPLELSDDGAADAADVEEEVSDDAEDDLTSLAQRLGALPLFACSAGFVLGGVTVYLALRPRLRRDTGSDEQKAPFIES